MYPYDKCSHAVSDEHAVKRGQHFLTPVRPLPLTSTPKVEGNITCGPNTTINAEQKDENPALRKALSTKIKPATFDGSGNWLDYKAHFEVCTELNGWTQHEKGMYLAVSLRGQAQGVFGNIANKSHDYTELIKVLEERFAPPNQTELYRVQLRERKQKASETLSELGEDIRRLSNLAYPTAPSDVRETLVKEQFIDALVSSDMRLRIKQARPENLNDAVRHAVELEAFNRAERKHLESQGYMRSATERQPEQKSNVEEELKSFQKMVFDLQNSFEGWKQQKQRDSYHSGNYRADNVKHPKRKCYLCGSDKHLKFRCPKNSANKNNAFRTSEEKSGHQAKYVQDSVRNVKLIT